MSKPRSIFEEVGATPAPSNIVPLRRGPQPARRAIAIWLSLIFLLVTLMIAVGGMTRLTDSGLSITEWKPVTGAIPPLDATTWTTEFDKYRATPQAKLANPDMTLTEFKSIYWWEWGHRQLGRLIGAVWALGFLYFAARRQIPKGWTPRLLALGLLGGLQGAIGWWMVSSGLQGTMVSVASHRLAIHLGLAFAILGTIAWFVLALNRTEAELLQARRQRNPRLMTWGTILIAAAFAQILLGALVAGIDAGRDFPEWPLMAGQIIPPDAFTGPPLENPGLMQFLHRTWGYILFALALAAFLAARKSSLTSIRKAFAGVFHTLTVQIALGIATVLLAAPWQIAILHQFTAVIVFTLIIRARFTALYPKPQKIARG